MSSAPPRARRVIVALACGLAASLLVVSPGQAFVPVAPEGVVAGADSPAAVPGRYIVTLKAGARNVSTASQKVISGRVTERRKAGFTARLSAREARRLAADPAVGVVEQDRIIRLAATQTNPVWNLDRIDQRSRTMSRTYRPMDDGSSVHAYVIDTGVKITHKQFGGRATYGWDFYDGDRYADDCHGHGTHVAGTIGGSTYGAAKRVKLVAVRVLNCSGAGYLSDVIDGVNWVTDHAIKPAVANMSLGSEYSSSLERAVQASIDSGVTYVVAAGNSNQEASYSSPAGLPSAITVAATDSRDRRASFSNWGPSVDLFAPGVSILSAYKGTTTSTAIMSGTSMAAPHVTGAAAMVLDAAPTWTPRQVRDFLVAKATTGVVVDRKYAPNRLLFVPAPPPPPAIKAATLPYARVGVAYRAQLSLVTARRGTWTLASGTLPAGLTLSRTTGLISGTPTTVTSARTIVVRFTDYVPQSTIRSFTLSVRA